MRALMILTLGLALATIGSSANRIVGGTETTISQYPFAAALLLSGFGFENFRQSCGGSIINNRAALTVAHCFDFFDSPHHWRLRVGSSYSNSSGVVVTTNIIIKHPNYVKKTLDNDIAILRINGAFAFNDNVRAGAIAGTNYKLVDNAPLWLIGWGAIRDGGPESIQLRHVQVWVINQAICRVRYIARGDVITDNMMCSGYLDVGGRDACDGDSGGAVLHNNVIVGLSSWGHRCAHPHFPGVNTRVPRYTSWIQNNR